MLSACAWQLTVDHIAQLYLKYQPYTTAQSDKPVAIDSPVCTSFFFLQIWSQHIPKLLLFQVAAPGTATSSGSANSTRGARWSSALLAEKRLGAALVLLTANRPLSFFFESACFASSLFFAVSVNVVYKIGSTIAKKHRMGALCLLGLKTRTGLNF